MEKKGDFKDLVLENEEKKVFQFSKRIIALHFKIQLIFQ